MAMLSIKTNTHLLLHLQSKSVSQKQCGHAFISCQYPKARFFALRIGSNRELIHTKRENLRRSIFQVIASGVEDVEVSSSQFKDFSVTTSDTNNPNEVKISIEVSGSTTQDLYDKVFTKMVADAQPIPGFRRVKGGKTPNIPKNILLEILGPSEVYKQVIKKIVNSTVAEYVRKEGLVVSKDLVIEQSFEDLEAKFEPGDIFRFDAIICSQDSN